MKRNMLLVASVFLTMAVLGLAYQGAAGKLNVKAGEEYYVCGCATCDCKTISSVAGKCHCGSDLVKAKVTQAKEDTAMFKAQGWDQERSFSTAGKYACACGGDCCKTISQKPGKCGCGQDLKQVAS